MRRGQAVSDDDLAKDQLVAAAKAVAALAIDRRITPRHVTYVEHDREIRAVLDRIIRRWSALTPVTYVTDAAAAARRNETSIEHIVPCRVLVDRMIMNPRNIRRLLEHGVVLARVTKEEHLRLGGIYTDHRKLYGWMLRKLDRGASPPGPSPISKGRDPSSPDRRAAPIVHGVSGVCDVVAAS